MSFHAHHLYLALTPAQVLLPTLAAVCYGDARLCELVEQRVSPEFVWRMLAQQVGQRQGGQGGQGVAGASSAAGGDSTGTSSQESGSSAMSAGAGAGSSMSRNGEQGQSGTGAASSQAQTLPGLQYAGAVQLGGSARAVGALLKAAGTAQGWGAVRPVWRHALGQRVPEQLLEQVRYCL